MYCGIVKPIQELDCSHFFSRRKESVRFDPENCDAFCRSCHLKLEHEKGETKGEVNGLTYKFPMLYRKWKIDQLGRRRFDALEVRAATHGKKDRRMALLRIRAMSKDFKATQPQIFGARAVAPFCAQSMMYWKPAA